MNYRNTAVLRLAQQHSCMACGADDGTVVAAHSNMGKHGKGMSMKAHDCFVAYVCMNCHSFIDFGSASKQVRQDFWTAAHYETRRLFWHLLDERGKQLLKEDEL